MHNNEDEKMIIDVGMHIGRDAKFYLEKGFKVIGIEANPALTEKVESELAEYIKTGQLIVLNIGIAEKEMTQPFYVNSEKDDWSSFIKDWNKSMWKENTEIKEYQVKCVPLRKIIAEYGVPYYLKIDVEGNDAECLTSLTGSKLPQYMSIELLSPNNLTDPNLIYTRNLIELYNFGYRKFQIVDQSANGSTVAPNPAREGKFVDFKFDGYSSGLFGKELPEDGWVNLDKVLFDYTYYLNNKHFPTYDGEMRMSGWFDVHATF